MQQFNTNYTPTWTCDEGPPHPEIQNGDLHGSYELDGYGNFRGDVFIRMGSVTTYGVGPWVFALPFSAAHVSGHGIALKAKSQTSLMMVVRFSDLGLTLASYLPDSRMRIGPMWPFQWETDDSLYIQYVGELHA